MLRSLVVHTRNGLTLLCTQTCAAGGCLGETSRHPEVRPACTQPVPSLYPAADARMAVGGARLWAIPGLCQHPAVVSRAQLCVCGAALLCCCNRGISELLPAFTGPFHFTATSTVQAAACAASKATAASKSNTPCPPEAGDLCAASSKALSLLLACPL